MIRTEVLEIDSLPSTLKSIKFGTRGVIGCASNIKIGFPSCTAKAKLAAQLLIFSKRIIERRDIEFSIQRC